MVIERPSCWILSDGTIGMEVQCIALAEALGFEYDKKHVKPYWLNRIFPSLAKLPGIPLATNFKQVTSQSSPDILITCGRRHGVERDGAPGAVRDGGSGHLRPGRRGRGACTHGRAVRSARVLLRREH